MTENMLDTTKLKDVLGELSTLLNTSERQEKTIAIWEEMWTRRLPEAAQRAGELAEAIDDLGRDLNPEETEEIGEVLAAMSSVLGMATTEKAPNPDLIAIWYLRRMDDRLARLEKRIG